MYVPEYWEAMDAQKAEEIDYLLEQSIDEEDSDLFICYLLRKQKRYADGEEF